MSITEPATLGTDVAMAILALVWSANLKKNGLTGAKAAWSRAFLALALTSFVGGVYHGFGTNFPENLSDLLWRITLALGSCSSLFMLLAGTAQFDRPERKVLWKVVGLSKFFLCVVAGIADPQFLVVLLDFSMTMIVLAVMAVGKFQVLPGAAIRLLEGVLLFLAGGLVQQFHLAPHPAFNHNDLFHVIQILGNLMFYLCARYA